MSHLNVIFKHQTYDLYIIYSSISPVSLYNLYLYMYVFLVFCLQP